MLPTLRLFGVNIPISTQYSHNPDDKFFINYSNNNSAVIESSSTSMLTSISSKKRSYDGRIDDNSVINDDSKASNSTVIKAQPLNWYNPAESLISDQFYHFITTVLGGDKDSVMFILEKTLMATDVNGSQSRLSLPKTRLKVKSFLTDSEEEWLSKKDHTEKWNNKLQVLVIDPCLRIWDGNQSLLMSKWKYHRNPNNPNSTPSWSYALKTNWNNLKCLNHLQQGQSLQVWCFRVNGKLGLALIRI